MIIMGKEYKRKYQHQTYDTVIFLSKVSLKLSSINNGYIKSGYAYGNSYNEPEYAGEREIGEMSKREMIRKMFNQQNSMYQYNNYYPHAHYAYAV